MIVTQVHLSDDDVSAMLSIAEHGWADEDRDSPGPLPWGLLHVLNRLVPSDQLAVYGQDTPRWSLFAAQGLPELAEDAVGPGLVTAYREHYWASWCSYPDATGDLESVTLLSDFYSIRQLHDLGMYVDVCRPLGVERELRVSLPAGAPRRTVRVVFLRGGGPDFSDRERALLTLLRPHLLAMFRRARQRAAGQVALTERQRQILDLVADGATNLQVAHRLRISEATVRKHLENAYGRLDVTSRTAAVARLRAGADPEP